MEQTHGWRVGSLSGIPVYLGRSWLLVAGVVVVLFGPTVQRVLPGTGAMGYVVALGFAVLLLVSVLVHEAAHALVAQRVGFRVQRVVADFWGGHTAYESRRTSPARSAAVAVVGPLSNGLLALLGWALLGTADGLGPVAVLLVYAFTWANGFVALFNLVPGLPLDGGFLLEAGVWAATGQRHRGTVVAAWAGRVFALAVVLWALWPLVAEGQRLSLGRMAWTLLIASFLWQGSSAALRGAQARGQLARRRVQEVLRPAGSVRTDATIAQVPWGSHRTWVAVDGAGLPVGLVDARSLQGVPAAAHASTEVGAVVRAQPLGWVVPAEPGEDVLDVAEAMARHQTPVVAVVDAGGALRGVVLASDLEGPRS